MSRDVADKKENPTLRMWGNMNTQNETLHKSDVFESFTPNGLQHLSQRNFFNAGTVRPVLPEIPPYSTCTTRIDVVYNITFSSLNCVF